MNRSAEISYQITARGQILPQIPRIQTNEVESPSCNIQRERVWHHDIRASPKAYQSKGSVMIKSQIRVHEQEQPGAKVNGPGSKGDDEEGTIAKGWLLIGR